MNLMNQISQAIKSNAKQPVRWTANLALIFSFVIIAIGYLAYNNVQTNLVKAQSGEWYSIGGTWGYRQKITVDHLLVAADQVNFPILINATNVNWQYATPAGHMGKGNAGDILFTDSSGIVKLNHEIEKYDPITGELIAWIKIDNLSASADTSIYTYYGNAAASDQWNPAGVWDANFKLVQHLNDDNAATPPTRTKDSTANNNDGTKIAVGQPAEKVGKIGMAQSFNGNGKISTPLNTTFGDFTVEVWFQDTPSPNSVYERLLDKSYTAGFWLGRNNAVANSWGGGIKENSSDPEGDGGYGIFGTFTDGVWNHLVSVRSGTTHLLYANGTLVKQNTVVGDLLDPTPIALGAWSDPSQTQQRLSGSLDEVRISDTPRSADWIKTSYNNESDPSAFVSFGLEETEVIPVPVTITISQPTAGTEWKIGDTETIRWTVSFPPSLGPPTTFKLDYSSDNGITWNLIKDNVAYIPSPLGQAYDWQIPIVDGPGGSDFKIKIEAYDSLPALVATAESSAFNIDYGPVVDLGFAISMNGQPLHNKQLAVNTAFTLSATAKDKYNYPITNFNTPLDLSVNSILSGVPTFNYSTLGNGSDTGTWSNGTVSFNEYQLFVSDQNLGSLPLAISIGIMNLFPGPVANTTIDNLILNQYGIFIFEPNGETIWNINDTETITYRFGGVTPPTGSVGRFFYSQNNGADFVAIKDDLGNDLELPYSSLSELNYAWLLDESLFDVLNLNNKFFQIKAQFVDEKGTPADTSDDVQLSETTTDSFIITDIRIALAGTYTSPRYVLNSGTTAYTLTSLDSFSATYGPISSGHSKVEFAISFYDANNQILFATLSNSNDGWFVWGENGDFSDIATFATDNSLSVDELALIKKVQFRIYMETDDYNNSNPEFSPYVETLSLNYQIDTLEPTEVGVINFNPNDNTGSHKSVVRGNPVNFGVTLIVADAHKSEFNQVTLNSIVAGGASGVTINPVTIACGGAIISCPATIIVSTSSTATLGVDWSISITVAVTGHPEMFFTPNPLQGYLTITDGTVPLDFSLAWLAGGESEKTVKPGETASFNVLVSFPAGFTGGNVTMSTDAVTAIGSTYITSAKFYQGATESAIVIPPATLPGSKTVELKVVTKTSGGVKTRTTFAITGTKGTDTPKSISPVPALIISSEVPTSITIEAKAVVEGGVAGDYQTPTFNLRLYKKGVSGSTGLIVSRENIKTSAYNETTKQATIRFAVEKATTATTGKLVEGDTYIGYLRSTRHLWQKATTPTNGEITITTTGTTYTLEFPILIAGDISPAVPDDEINSLDWSVVVADLFKTVSGLLPDFDNNGQINVLDLSFIIINYFKRSALMP